MIFEDFYWSFIGIWLYNKLIEAFVYSNYNDFTNVELMRIEIFKLTLILPVIALLSELYVFIKNRNSKVFHHRKLKEQKLKIEDIKHEKSLILMNSLFIFFILLFFISQKPEESGQSAFYFILLNFIIIELYFVINSFNNIITRNGIYQNGIFFMGKSYPWHKIDDIRLKKHNREILLIKKLPVIGNIKTKISYSKDQVEEYIEKMKG